MPALPEFKQHLRLQITAGEAEQLKKLKGWTKDEIVLSSGSIPKYSKILAVTTKVNMDGDRGGDCQGSEELPWTVSYGVPRSPKEFFLDSIKAPHPLELPAAVPDDLRQAVVNILQLGKSGWAAEMERLVSSWAEEVGKLQVEEAGIHKDLHPDVEIVVGEEHLSLFKKMLASIDYPDHKIANS